MVNEEIVGTDIDRSWTLNAGKDDVNGTSKREGDLNLVRGSDNLSQAIFLRLTAYYDELKKKYAMDWAYDYYGSSMKDWLGKTQNVYNRTMLTNEINKRVDLDPRINNSTAEIIDWTPYTMGIKIDAVVDGNKTFQEYYIFSDLPRKDENINSPMYKNTYIETKTTGYYGKVGELLTVYCIVRDSDDKIVPIGEVSLLVGGTIIKENDVLNPQEIAQSGSKNPGTCIFTFHIPRYLTKGTHELQFKYKGIRGYNSCVGTTNLYIVDRVPTSMSFIPPNKERDWYYANDYDYLTEPVVHVIDANDYDVLHGEVKYYLSDYGNDNDIILIEFPIIFHGSRLIHETCVMYVSSKVLEYSAKFMFQTPLMFKPGDIFEIIGKNEEHIDYLECEYKDHVFVLASTTVTKPYELFDKDGKRLDCDRNDDIDVQRHSNTGYKMKVVE